MSFLFRIRKWWYCRHVQGNNCISCPYHMAVWDRYGFCWNSMSLWHYGTEVKYESNSYCIAAGGWVLHGSAEHVLDLYGEG